MKTSFRYIGVAAIAALCAVIVAAAASADHSWGGYHWERSQNPVILQLGDNVSSAWDGHLDVAIADWNVSDVLSLTKVSGSANVKNCRPGNGAIEVCNDTYGNNGWLGVAQIWVDGNHITKASTKLNDTYFNTAPYNNPAWRQMVVCQEIGHAFGLDHQDEDFYNDNLDTCMDYTSDPVSNQHPDDHDYVELGIIYEHLDSDSGGGGGPPPWAGGPNAGNAPSEWGRLVSSSRDGRLARYELNLGNGHKIFTFVIWAR